MREDPVSYLGEIVNFNNVFVMKKLSFVHICCQLLFLRNKTEISEIGIGKSH